MQLDDLVKAVDNTSIALKAQTDYVAALKKTQSEQSGTTFAVYCGDSWTNIDCDVFIGIQTDMLNTLQATYDKLVKVRTELQAALDAATAVQTAQPAPPAQSSDTQTTSSDTQAAS